ncbi:MAG: hypothetical protein CMJ77_09865 [Planctomycetaceae bacterium]|nr:hypothetical protein [Planctomycetaceae bacterium]
MLTSNVGNPVRSFAPEINLERPSAISIQLFGLSPLYGYLSLCRADGKGETTKPVNTLVFERFSRPQTAIPVSLFFLSKAPWIHGKSVADNQIESATRSPPEKA